MLVVRRLVCAAIRRRQRSGRLFRQHHFAEPGQQREVHPALLDFMRFANRLRVRAGVFEIHLSQVVRRCFGAEETHLNGGIDEHCLLRLFFLPFLQYLQRVPDLLVLLRLRPQRSHHSLLGHFCLRVGCAVAHLRLDASAACIMHSDVVARYRDSQPLLDPAKGVQHLLDISHNGLLQRHRSVRLRFAWLFVENALDLP